MKRRSGASPEKGEQGERPPPPKKKTGKFAKYGANAFSQQ